ALQEVAHELVAASAVRCALDRAAQIVGDVEYVFGEVRGTEARGIAALALSATAHVLRLRERAQQAVLGLGELGFDDAETRLNPRPRRYRLRLLAGGRRLSVVVFWIHVACSLKVTPAACR